MENEMQIEAIPKKIWSVMRVFYFMLKKGVSKRKLSLHLNIMMKRSKMAGKSIGNVMFHNQPAAAATADLFNLYKAAEYEFSCSNTPAHHKFLFKKKKHSAHYESQYEAQYEEFMTEALNDAVVTSPILPDLLRFKPVRVTDSPFPIFSGRVDEGECHVDEAADEFISKFYRQLRRQSLTDG